MSSHDRHPDDDTILALAHGLLTGSVRDQVMDHVRECPQCEDQLRACARARETAISDGPPSSLLTGAPTGNAAGGRRWSRWRTAALAATAACLVLWIGFELVFSPEADRAEFWLASDLELTSTRSDDPSGPAGLDHALAAYGRRDLVTALEEFEALEVDGAWTGLRDSYVLSIYVNTGQFASAEDVLDRMQVESLPSSYRIATRWYRSLLHLGTGRTDEARRELTELSSEAGPIGDLARAKLHQMEPES